MDLYSSPSGQRSEIRTDEIVAGIETEFGIIRKDQAESDPVRESMDLVKAYRPRSFGAWAYEAEDPRADARGFRVDRLAQDEEEEAFSRSDRQRNFSFRESKSDRILQNGARFYNDHTHPEYSTPECQSIRDLVLYDRAGTRILQSAMESREGEIGVSGSLGIYRNNSDFHGHSYGCHENYLLPRSIPFDRIVEGLTPFLVSRTLFLGAGKVGQEGEDGMRTGGFQLSQRADFMEERIGVDTMHRRPIVNSRDEPHAAKGLFRRLHLICGDANMCEWQTAMKIGMTRLVLASIVNGSYPRKSLLADPVRAFRQLSRSEDGKGRLLLDDGRSVTADEMLEDYRSLVDNQATNEEDRWILSEWDKALRDYRKDPVLLSDRVDWVAKKNLLGWFAEEEGIPLDDPCFQSLDLAYHDLDEDLGMFWPLETDGSMVRLTDPEDVDAATVHPPGLGRPPIRAAVLNRFRDQIRDAGWERVAFVDGTSVDLPLFLSLREEEVRDLCSRIGKLKGPSDLLSALSEWIE
jgi:proteasome accessory factor A